MIMDKPSGTIAKARLRQRQAKPRIAAMMSLLLLTTIGGLIVLASQTSVPQITRAPGQIVPLGDHTQIETMEGGIVAQVRVDEGQTVAAGDILISLYNPGLRREHETLTEQRRALTDRLANARSVLSALDMKTPLAADFIASLTASGLLKAAADLHVHSESQRIRAVSIASQQETLEILEEAAALAEDRASRRADLLDQSRNLFDQGLMTQRDFRGEEDQADAAKAQASDALVRLAQARNTLTLTRAEAQQETLALRDKVLTEIDTLEQEFAEIGAALAIAADRLDRLDLSAPVPGVVQSVAFPNLGEVIEPGETIFELLPTRQVLVVEARIPGNDIGHVHVDHAVSVSIDNYDVRRYGTIPGRVASFSPIPLTDEDTGAPYFRAMVEIEGATIGQGAFRMPLVSGMAASSEITTGDQTLLSYFLRPMEFTLSRAFSER